MYRGGGGGVGGGGNVPIGGNLNGNNYPFDFRQQQNQQGMMVQNQIGQQRRMDLLSIGKRSFGDYQQQQQQFQQQQQQQQQQQRISYLQGLQQQQQLAQPMMSQNQYLMRSIKQRTNNNNNNHGIIPSFSPIIDLTSPTNNNNNINVNNNNNFNGNVINNNNNINVNNNNNFNGNVINNNNNNNCSARFGVPVYQLPKQQQQQQQIPLLNTYQFNNQIQNQNQNQNQTQLNQSNNAVVSTVNPVQKPVEPEEGKIRLHTLEELEKHLLNDDDYDAAMSADGDAVSVITNTDWSETFYELMGSSPIPSPTPNPEPSPNANPDPNLDPNPDPNSAQPNVISPSPTSSASSCCSASVPATATASPKQLIVDVATAISEGNNDVAIELLSKLNQIGDRKGNSEQRLAYHIHNALQSRALSTQNPAQIAELRSVDQTTAMYTLYDVSPCFKFGILAANLVMLEAITSVLQEGGKAHIIDFDVGQGGQYVNLIRALADRKGDAQDGRVALRITVVETEFCNPGVVSGSVKDALVELAERVGIDLKYTCLTRTIHELNRESLGCEEGESVVVNLAFKVYRVPDESVSVDNLRDALLRRVKGLSPRAVTLVEQDMNGNTAPFVSRVNEACGYYGALFDSLDTTLTRDSLDRSRVEDGLGRKIVNIIACEGKDRVDRCEVFGKWRARMGMAGFDLKVINRSVVESMQAKFDSARGGNPGFTVKNENGGVGFGWNGRNLTTTSAWR